MRNNLIGIIISALLHLSVLGWIVSSESIKQPTIINTVALMVSMFEAEIIPVATPTPPVIKKIEKRVKIPQPIKVAALVPTPKIKIKPVVKKPKTKAKKKRIKPTKAKLAPKRIKPKKIVRVVKKKNRIKRVSKTKKPVRRVSKRTPKKLIKHATKKRIVKKPLQHRRLTPKATQKRIVKRAPPPAKRKQYKKPRHTVTAKAQARSRTTAHKNRPINKRQYTQHRRTHVKPAPRRNTKPRARPQNKQYAKKVVAPQHKKNAKPRVAKRAIVAQSSQNGVLTKQYKARLQQLIASNKHYPKRAKRRGHQGSVTLSFRVTHSGNIVGIKIIKGANNNDLNRAAIRAIQQSSRKLAYTKGMDKQSLILTITLTYVLS